MAGQNNVPQKQNGNNNNVPEKIKLGNGEVFVRRDNKGSIKVVKACVELSEALNEIAKVGDKFVIQIAGFSKLNQIANINILTPPTCIVDGIAQSNPHVERHPKSKVIQTVIVRKIGFGYSPTGNIVAIDNTLFFNIFTYFIQDLQTKIKIYPTCGCLGTKNKTPGKIKYITTVWKTAQSGKKFPDEGPEKEKDFTDKNMVFYEIEDPVGIWIDISHPEIQRCFDSHTQRQKFGDRHAQSICERNCLKKHPAIASNNVNALNGFANVYVYGWKHDLDFNKLNKISNKISSGEIDDKEIEVQSSTETADYEDVKAEETTELDEFGQSPIDSDAIQMEPSNSKNDNPEPSNESDQKKSPKELELEKNIEIGRDIIGEDKYKIILEKLNINDITNANIQMKKAVLSIISTAADKK